MIVGNPIIMILKAILNWFRLRRDYIANAVDKIPPEIKDALVACYSPVKQKLSNYDVIESYIIDFTTFNNRDDAIINNNKFVFTGRVVVGVNYELIQVEKYNSYKILIKGLTGGIYYYYRNVDGVEKYIIFNKDGIYDIPVSYKQGTEGIIMGYTCDSTTECTVTQLPTSILKDFSGNKHNAYLYGFKGKLNSGVGIYAQDFKNWNYGSAINKDISTKSYNKFHIVKKKADSRFGFTIGISKNNYYNQTYKLKFSINKKIDDIKFSVASTDGNSDKIPLDTDYLTLMFGLNETNLVADDKIGDKNSVDDTTWWGAWNKVLEYYITNMPYCKIGIIIADAWFHKTLRDELIKISNYWGIPYLDLKGDLQVPMMLDGRYDNSIINSKVIQLRNKAFQTSDTDHHPNPKGHLYRSTIIENFLRRL